MYVVSFHLLFKSADSDCEQVEAGLIFSGHWILYLFFRTCLDIGVALNYRYRRYKSIQKFRSIIDMDFPILIYRVSNLTWAITS